MRSSASKVGMDFDPDGLSSSDDLMKAVGFFSFVEKLSEGPTGDPGVCFGLQ